MLKAEPSERNSNLLPVNANGDVRLRSVVSAINSGMVSTTCILLPFLPLYCAPLCMESSMFVSSEPRNMDIIAGGASFAPRRWSLPALATLRRNRSCLRSTAFITAVKKSKKRRLVSGDLPGLRRFSPVSVHIDQLSCLPLPLTPANGFSCNRHTSPCRSASFFITSMVS